ncbi:DMT family transporter [Desmospora profundinema]|uniref:DME family drug/metabolite transporter n=1 Tax=Desmospora profundinema TaxID=1571184 RepID=A0ABU1ILV7_9BACL|nr:EamA family transporter [Desmospora profundinema]MDR6225767.1 DME family drug/metabolite transporter [Desmospora profundinema]
MKIGLWWVCLGAIGWGTAGLAAKFLVLNHDMTPLEIGAWRLVIGAPLLLAAAAWESRGHVFISPGMRGIGWILLFGLALAGYQVAYFSAVDRTLVSTATLLTVCTAPLLVAAFSAWKLREPLGSKTMLALGLGMAGVTLVIGIGGLIAIADSRFWMGNLLALGAAVCYGGYTLVGKHLVRWIPPFRTVAAAFVVGAVILLPFIGWPPSSWVAWGLLLYLGVVPTALAYLLYMTGLKRTSATRASIAALLEPLTASLLAVWLLGERLPPAGWLGAFLLLSSLMVMVLPERKQNSTPPDTIV